MTLKWRGLLSILLLLISTTSFSIDGSLLLEKRLHAFYWNQKTTPKQRSQELDSALIDIGNAIQELLKNPHQSMLLHEVLRVSIQIIENDSGLYLAELLHPLFVKYPDLIELGLKRFESTKALSLKKTVQLVDEEIVRGNG